MPKEVIYDEAEMYDLQVGWRKDGEAVQVGIESHDGQSLAFKLAGSNVTATGDVELPETATSVEALAQFTGLWATLDRVSINRLIRTLRTARDQAYGRDE